MFRLGFLNGHGIRYPVAIRHGEDFLMVFEALARGARYVLTRRPGYLYTVRSAGRSRTRIDYEGQAAAAIRLAESARTRGDPTLASLCRVRASALRRLSAERQAETSWRERDLIGLGRLAVANRHGAAAVARRAKHWILR